MGQGLSLFVSNHTICQSVRCEEFKEVDEKQILEISYHFNVRSYHKKNVNWIFKLLITIKSDKMILVLK